MPPEENAAADIFGNDQPSVQAPAQDVKTSEGAPPPANEHESLISELRGKIQALENTNSAKEKNIQNMKQKLESLTGKNAGPGGEDVAFFADIKTTKDLSSDELDEMTDTERRQFDDIASLKTGINKLAQLIASKSQNDAPTPPDSTTPPEQNIDQIAIAKRIALEVASNDAAVANEIIEQVNKFSLDGLTEEEIRSRVNDANSLRPSYVPTTGPIIKRGQAVGGGVDSDPFGSNKIIEKVVSQQAAGSYNL